MSMISEQVKGLRKLGNQWKHNDVAGCNLIFDAADTIEALSAKLAAYNLGNGGWIPVSERLPEKYELVLVTVWNDVCTAWRNIYGGWESAENLYEKGDVTAWMPLPEPYREDGEEE